MALGVVDVVVTHPCEGREDVIRSLSAWGAVPVVIGALALEALGGESRTREIVPRRPRRPQRRRRRSRHSITDLDLVAALQSITVPDRQDPRANSRAREFLRNWIDDPSPENAALVYAPGARYTNAWLKAVSKYVLGFRNDPDPEGKLLRSMSYSASDSADAGHMLEAVANWALTSLLPNE